MSFKLLKDHFDIYITDEKTPIYLKKNKTINNKCCGLIEDEKYSFNVIKSYSLCNEECSNSYLCKTHKNCQNYEIILNNNCFITLTGTEENDNHKIQIFHEDNFLSKFISDIIPYEKGCEMKDHCIGANEPEFFKNCKCIKKYYPDYLKTKIKFYPESTTVFFSFYTEKNKLLFKGIVKDNLNLSKTIDILEVFYNKKTDNEKRHDIILKMEPWFFINKKICMNEMLNNTPICKDIIEKIVELNFKFENLLIVSVLLQYFNNKKYRFYIDFQCKFIMKLLIKIIRDCKAFLDCSEKKILFIHVFDRLKNDMKYYKLEIDDPVYYIEKYCCKNLDYKCDIEP